MKWFRIKAEEMDKNIFNKLNEIGSAQFTKLKNSLVQIEIAYIKKNDIEKAFNILNDVKILNNKYIPLNEDFGTLTILTENF